MEPRRRHFGKWARLGAKAWAGYALAVGGTAAAALLRWAVGVWIGEVPPFITFYPVVMAAAVVGGTRAGIVATALVALAADLFFIPPVGRLWPLEPGYAAGMVLFIGLNLGISVVGGAQQKAYRRARLQAAALESAANAMVITDRQGVIQWVNRAFEELAGYSAGEAVGQTPRVLSSGQHDPAFFKQMWETISAGRVWRGEVVNRRRSGELYTEEMTITPVSDPAGVITHFIAVKQDVTGRKETEARMRALSQRRAEDLAAMERLHEVSTRFAGREDLSSLLDAILDAAIAVIRGNKGYLQMVDRASGELPITVQRGFDAAFVEFFSHIRPGTAACGAAMQTKQSVVVQDITLSPLFLAEPRALELKLAAGMRAVVCTPLLTRSGQLLGVLSVHFAQVHRPSERDLSFLSLLARQAADLLELRQAEEDLLERNAELDAERARWEGLVQSIADEVWTCDAEGHTSLANLPALAARGFYGLGGKSLEEAFGDTEVLNPEGRPRPAEEAPLVRSLRGEIARGEEILVHRLTGNRRWRHFSSAPARDESGRITGAVAILRDITEQKRTEEALRESERQFRMLADSIPTLAWRANADGYITWYNRRWYDYTGTTPEQMEGWGWQKVHDPQMLPAVLERWQQSIATGEPFEMEFPLRGADGRFRWFLTRIIPLRDAAGKVVQWFGTNTDVSETRQAREVLARSKQELERLVEERTARLRETVEELEGFSYSIVHDMRAPLRAMQNFALLAQEACAGCDRSEGPDYFRRIRTASHRLDQLITDALNYSKIMRQELPVVQVDAGRLLRDIVETYPNLHEPKVEIQAEFESLVVMGNESALTQVFSNLLGNAAKFVAPGVKPRIRVWAEEAVRSAENGGPNLARGKSPVPSGVRSDPAHPASRSALGQVRIWIEDNGIGIPPSAHQKIFGMFQRMHGQDEYPGTGIGLTIVRKAVERMGGRVGVESEPGKGSRFYVELDRGTQETARESSRVGGVGSRARDGD